MQKTIKNAVSLSGAGLHTGQNTSVSFKPAQANQGVRFVRVDLPGKPSVKLESMAVVMDPLVTRCTALEANGVRILTVEHVLAALNGLGIDNLTIEISGPEVPGLDGSSLEFVRALESAGIEVLNTPRRYLKIHEPIVVANDKASIVMVPSNSLEVSYTLDYNHPFLRAQTVSFEVKEQTFVEDIAGARTFCLESEVPEIHARGLGRGATHHNTLVIANGGPLDNSFRFKDECARHKVLDIIGDLFLLGFFVHGKVYASKSGHALNRILISKIDQQQRNGVMSSKQRIFDINDIMKFLPHRYPFLFVDRIIEVERGKKGIGIKNVTINDGFFQGHFPTKPVMPGVLMVEAMAQTAGVIVLASGHHPGKVALFMAIEAVKFRKIVSPGDQLIMEIEIIRDRERTAQVKGVGKVGGEAVVEAEMLFSYTDAVYLKG
ncbi:MAG: UDP-3-O-[3-hydroxymyristoyl] N-acetylglucosamine deacetylase [Candidatus Omnitrophica bacterium]|nr:UDP-3-O-[3-hydroxymyristoyl] N-acetylglucosamine deacetylase [Candidatus Omnitrophota bacterium]